MAITHKFSKLPSQCAFERDLAPGHTCVISQFPAPVAEGNLAVAPDPVALPAPAKRQRGATKAEDQLKALRAKVQIAKRDLMKHPGFDDVVYRGILDRLFGVSSSTKLSYNQLHVLAAYFASLGWQAKKKRHRKEAPAILTSDPGIMDRRARMKKIEAMLAEKGRVEGTDMPWGYAVGILKCQTGGEVKSFDKAEPRQLDDVIAALYRDAVRKGRRVR